MDPTRKSLPPAGIFSLRTSPGLAKEPIAAPFLLFFFSLLWEALRLCNFSILRCRFPLCCRAFLGIRRLKGLDPSDSLILLDSHETQPRDRLGWSSHAGSDYAHLSKVVVIRPFSTPTFDRARRQTRSSPSVACLPACLLVRLSACPLACSSHPSWCMTHS